MENLKKFNHNAEVKLLALYKKIGIDKPENHEEILAFITDDIQKQDYHINDVVIAFGHYIESKK